MSLELSDRYQDVAKRINALIADEDDPIALMATLACELFHSDPRFDWVGFYRVVVPGLLKIGPYQGGHGCLTISYDRGVCGAAAREEKTQNVPDVNAFPGHIACASSTQSEIVLPVWNGAGVLVAVLDIDSDRPAAFDSVDERDLAQILNATFRRLP